jgi:hypothetical protein
MASVRQEAPRVDLVLSVNDDIWNSAFKPALSGGLQDRLGEIALRLEPLDEAAMASLLEARNPGRAAALRGRLGLSPEEFYARRVLKKAAEIDDDSTVPLPAATAMAPPAPAVAASLPPVIPEVHPEIPADPAPPTPPVPLEAAEPVFPPTEPWAGRPEESDAGDFVAPVIKQEADEEVPPASGGDRIDDLLRQFRERYGRE